MGEATWTTRDGAVIAVRAMTDRHLVNTLHFIERAWRRALNEAADAADSYGGLGEVATFYADMDAARARDRAARMDPDDIADDFPAYLEMLDEAKRRRLIDHDYTPADSGEGT